jgi:hypothetical protein
MNQRAAGRLAWTLWALTIVTASASWTLVYLSRSAPVRDVIGFRGFDALLAVAFASVGAVVVARLPSHAVGWLLLAFGASNGPISLAQQYAFFAIVGRADPLPGGTVAAWGQEWISVSQGAFFVLLLLLFPTGRLPSRRWRPVVGLAIAGSILEALGGAFEAGPIATFRALANPYGVTGTFGRLLALGDLVGNILFTTTVLAAVVSIILRFRRAERIERLQLKWIAAAATLVGVGLVGFVLTGQEAGTSPFARPVQIFFILALVGIPVAAGLAIVRYRLFDIDRIISRTVSYGIVTGLLIGVYAGLVVVFQRVTNPFTEGSDLAVGVSTLVVAVAFVPLRRRVQAVVDRRFNRARYDANRTIEEFSARLREEIDLDTLTAELQSVVARTMQPDHVSLWLRGET